MPLISNQFPNIRGHIFKKGLSKMKWRGSAKNNYDKKQSRLKRKAEIANSTERQLFFDWIDGIQAKLNLTTREFAELLYVEYQTLQLWKRRTGHYPSQRSFKRLLELERQTRLCISDLQTTIKLKRS